MLDCNQATTRLEALNLLRETFLSCLEKASTGAKNPVEAKDALERARQLKAALETGMRELSRELAIEIIVPEAINPYAEALREAGLPVDHLECAKKKEVTFNLEELIQSHCDRYTAQGMSEWVEDIQTNKALLENQHTIPEEMDKIEKRIKSGLVPILMPGRQVQMDTWEKALQKLKPSWIDSGTEIPLTAPFVDSRYPEKMTPPPNPDGSMPPTFFDHLPDRPYLVWTKPTKEIDPATATLTFDQQKEKLAELHTQDRDLVDATDLTPVEYAALQSIHSNTIRQRAGGYVPQIQNITPLDKSGYTRFLSNGLFSHGSVPFACFDPDDARLLFGGVDVGANSKHGFRPAARS